MAARGVSSSPPVLTQQISLWSLSEISTVLLFGPGSVFTQTWF